MELHVYVSLLISQSEEDVTIIVKLGGQNIERGSGKQVWKVLSVIIVLLIKTRA